MKKLTPLNYSPTGLPLGRSIFPRMTNSFFQDPESLSESGTLITYKSVKLTIAKLILCPSFSCLNSDIFSLAIKPEIFTVLFHFCLFFIFAQYFTVPIRHYNECLNIISPCSPKSYLDTMHASKS